MHSFKTACELGVSVARMKVAGPDEWGEDNAASVTENTLAGALRAAGRSVVEGLGGGTLGFLAGGALGRPLDNPKSRHAPMTRELSHAGLLLGLGSGALHGYYASRRNQRKELAALSGDDKNPRAE